MSAVRSAESKSPKTCRCAWEDEIIREIMALDVGIAYEYNFFQTMQEKLPSVFGEAVWVRY